MLKQTSRVVLSLVLLIGLAEPAAGNGCTTRPATQAEKNFQIAAKTAIKDALPPAPAGWKVIEEGRIHAEDRVCEGTEKEPMRVLFGRRYQRVEGVEQREREMMAVLMKAQPTPEQKAGMDALMKETQQLAQRAAQAVQRQDFKEVERLSKDMDKVNKQIGAIQADIHRSTRQATEKYLPRDTQASIEVVVNYLGESLWKAQAVRVPGAAVAFRVGGDGERFAETDWREGTTLVFLGDWRASSAGREHTELKASRNPSAPHTKGQAMLIRIQADPERAHQLLEKMNLHALQALSR